MKGKRKPDFAGWVTKNDIKCTDGVIIKHDAFRENDGQKVPLVWNHNYSAPENVLGHVILQNHESGVYGYGYFNDTKSALHAKSLVSNRDINSMSMGARKLKRSGQNIVHGSIYEVSLVLAAANPGATIDMVLEHSDDDTISEAIIHTDNIIHSADDLPPVIEDKPKVDGEPKPDDKPKVDDPEDPLKHNDKTIQDVIDTMNPEQQDAVYALFGMVLKNDEEEGKDNMKHNVFDKETNQQDVIKHSLNEVLIAAANGKVSSLKDTLAAAKLEAQGQEGEALTHGINSIEMLFPEAHQSTNGGVPIIFKDPNTKYESILNGVSKSPFSRLKTTVVDLTEDEARAKGYIKGNFKKEEFFSLIRRVTQPTTIYKKQKLDRDDVIDITDFDTVAFMNAEMKMMLKEEIARALLVGDGRAVDNVDKIPEEHIRPIISDHDFFTIKAKYAAADKFVESVLLAMKDYRGSGTPTMFIDPAVLISVKLLKGTDGRYLTGHIPSNAELASIMGLSSIEETSFMHGKGALIVNLRDYTLGATKGGEITNFDDFDIDFNQYKYLIETRLCGTLTVPKSAIHMNPGNSLGVGANDAKGGLTKGDRQADKVVPPSPVNEG